MGLEVLIWNLHWLIIIATGVVAWVINYGIWSEKAQDRREATKNLVILVSSSLLLIIWMGLSGVDRIESQSFTMLLPIVLGLCILAIPAAAINFARTAYPDEKWRRLTKLKETGKIHIPMLIALIVSCACILLVLIFRSKVIGWLWKISTRDPALYVTADGQIRDQVFNSTKIAKWGWYYYFSALAIGGATGYTVRAYLGRKDARIMMRYKFPPILVSLIVGIFVTSIFVGVWWTDMWVGLVSDGLNLGYKVADIDWSQPLRIDVQGLNDAWGKMISGEVSVTTPGVLGPLEDWWRDVQAATGGN